MARGAKKDNALTPEEKLARALMPEAEQPYRVPGNWRWTKVGSVCRFIGGGTPSKDNSEYWDGLIPWASVKDVKVYDLPYPQMKLLDMGFWQIGFEKDTDKGLQVAH